MVAKPFSNFSRSSRNSDATESSRVRRYSTSKRRISISGTRIFFWSASDSHDMSSLTMRSIWLPPSRSLPCVPSNSVRPSSSWSATRAGEGLLQVGDAAFEQREVLPLRLAGQLLDGLQVRHRGRVRLAEAGDEHRLRLRDEFLGAHLHGGERVLEGAARVRQARGLLHAGEGRIDRVLARHVGDADRHEADDRNDREDDQAHAHGQRAAQARQQHFERPHNRRKIPCRMQRPNG